MESEALLSGRSKEAASAMKILKFGMVILIFLGAVGILTTGITVVVTSRKVKDTVTSTMLQVEADAIPRAYSVPYWAVTPVKDQQTRGTCWAFATIGLLEASYRNFGYNNYLIHGHNYVAFSEQAYALNLVQYCTKTNPGSPYCFGGPPQNQTDDGEIEWLYYLRHTAITHIIPESACPYDTNNQWDCPHQTKALKKNPISFSVMGIKTVYNVADIKSLLYEQQVPLGWSHAVFDRTYTVACAGNPVLEGAEECTECRYPCDISANGCCAELIIPGYTVEGMFQMDNQPYVDGGHAMLVVGWNDDFRADQGVFGDLSDYTTGGFILKNSWSASYGHTIGYWMQKWSQMDEDLICPCTKSSRKWLPADAQCMIATPDPIACAPGVQKYAGNQIINGATTLKCSSKALNPTTAAQLGWTDCNASYTYVLVQAPSIPESKGQPSGVWTKYAAGSNGALQFYLVGWDNTTTNGGELVLTGVTTWYGLENLLDPEVMVANDPRCGFFFWPYETLTEGNLAYPIGGHDTPAVSFIDIDWKLKSFYIYEDDNSNMDYEYVKSSTKASYDVIFKGPFDFNWTNNK